MFEGQTKGIDRPRPSDTVDAAFDYEKGPGYEIGSDGMPKPSGVALDLAPPMTRETLVCLPDERSFVVRDAAGDVVATFEPEVVRRRVDGGHEVAWWRGLAALLPALLLVRGLRGLQAALVVLAGLVVRVEPIRPRCRHFARQLMGMDGGHEHGMMERLCTARRDDMGNFLGLQNETMFACELRDPHDGVSHKRIRLFDDGKIHLGEKRLQESAEEGFSFDVDGELERLADEAQRDTGYGIFGR